MKKAASLARFARRFRSSPHKLNTLNSAIRRFELAAEKCRKAFSWLADISLYIAKHECENGKNARNGSLGPRRKADDAHTQGMTKLRPLL